MSEPLLDQFFRGCQTARPFRLRATPLFPGGGRGEPRRIELDAPFAVMGNDPRADVVLESPSLAPRHCFVQAFGPSVLCVALDPTAEVHGSDGPARAGWIERERGIRVGTTLLTLDPASSDLGDAQLANERFGESQGARRESSLIRGPLPRIELEVRSGARRRSWPMTRAFVLAGTADDCVLRFRDPALSHHHAAFVRTANGLWVVDLLSSIGGDQDPAPLIVNGEPVRCARLGAEDTLQLGNFTIAARYEAPTSPGKPRPEPVPRRAALGSVFRAELSGADPVESDDDSTSITERLVELLETQRAEIEALRREVAALRNAFHQNLARGPFAQPAHEQLTLLLASIGGEAVAEAANDDRVPLGHATRVHASPTPGETPTPTPRSPEFTLSELPSSSGQTLSTV